MSRPTCRFCGRKERGLAQEYKFHYNPFSEVWMCWKCKFIFNRQVKSEWLTIHHKIRTLRGHSERECFMCGFEWPSPPLPHTPENCIWYHPPRQFSMGWEWEAASRLRICRGCYDSKLNRSVSKIAMSLIRSFKYSTQKLKPTRTAAPDPLVLARKAELLWELDTWAWRYPDGVRYRELKLDYAPSRKRAGSPLSPPSKLVKIQT